MTLMIASDLHGSPYWTQRLLEAFRREKADQILLLGDIIIEKTAFTLKPRLPVQTRTGNLRLEGHVRGYVSGMVDADFNGTLHGTVNATIAAGHSRKQGEIEEEGDGQDA